MKNKGVKLAKQVAKVVAAGVVAVALTACAGHMHGKKMSSCSGKGSCKSHHHGHHGR